MELEVEPIELFADGFVRRVKGDRAVYVPRTIRASAEEHGIGVRLEIELHPDEDEAPQLVRYCVERLPGGANPPADMVRGVRIKTMVREAVRRSSQPIVWNGTDWTVELRAGTPETNRAVFRRGRRTVTNDEIRRAAEVYIEAVKAGRRDCLLAVAEALHVSRATAHRRIQRAEALGYLTNEEGTK